MVALRGLLKLSGCLFTLCRHEPHKMHISRTKQHTRGLPDWLNNLWKEKLSSLVRMINLAFDDTVDMLSDTCSGQMSTFALLEAHIDIFTSTIHIPCHLHCDALCS